MTATWFVLIAFLWTGYFVLEGFDFGVGMLLPVLGRDDRRRRILLDSIGPVWDGNEVWVITAGGATFAAFPEWYATLFSGFYLPLLLILLALIGRGVAFEYRGKRDDPQWRRRWDLCIVLGSLVPAVLWGIAFANILRGVPLDAQHEYAGTVLDLLSPYALLGGLTTGLLFATHGAVFLALKTLGPVRDQALVLTRWLGVPALASLATFLAWSFGYRRSPAAVILGALAVGAVGFALAARRREGWAFTGTAVAIASTVAALFAALYPAVLPSTLDPAGTLTVTNAASSPYTLKLMTWVAALFTPLVLLYQGWTYWVFRRRLS